MTIDEAIQILNLYDLGNMFLDIDGNPIGYEKMSSACDMAVEALKRQKTGKWIDCSDEGYVECPFCGHATTCEDNIDELHYCFYCGARMEAENGTI